MRIALLSDIHANVEALSACLAHAGQQGVDRHAFLGDLVGYGADPEAVLDIISGHIQAGALAVKGNHDEAIARSTSYFNDSARAALDLARAALSAEHKRLLAALPLVQHEERACYVHAGAAMPQRWEYIDSPKAAGRCVDASCSTYTFCGHVHEQLLYFENMHGAMNEFRPNPGTAIPVSSRRRWLAIVGSVGQPRDRNPAAAYALFDSRLEQLTFFRVPYDSQAAANSIRRRQLPESLANRVERGI